MDELARQLIVDLVTGVQLTGDIGPDVTAFLLHHGRPETAEHCKNVAAEAKRLAAQFGADERLAQTAGWLHDVSAVIPNEQRVQIAHQLELEVLPEEAAVPMILHQKLSAVMAHQIFGIMDKAALGAIECHTTLKANAPLLDKVVFLADKIAWDQSYTAPFLEGVLAALEQSLDRAVLHYLHYLWQQRDTMQVVHPWFVDAYKELGCAQVRLGATHFRKCVAPKRRHCA